MIKFHPNDSTLTSFVEGILPSTEALLVSAHCDMCTACLDKTRTFTDSIASRVFCDGDTNTNILREYVSMFESITHDRTLLDASFISENNRSIEVEGREFILPATLSRFADRIGEWSCLVGKLWQAPVDIGGGCLAQFIYMEKGGSVPEHTHRGNELTLVINGRFADGTRHYQSGDFIALNHEHTHTPCSDAYEGCLVLTILDKPLHFTSGWAKLINPLSQLYFKANTNL
ncbi:MAG: putative transcriptional regulator [Alphaproteobacteria bacterium]|jgi:putative transcriptional regulator